MPCIFVLRLRQFMTKFLIVGLGNPGDEYASTRHNIGFDVLDYIAKKKEGNWESVRHGWRTEIGIKGRKLILIKPNTYMNLSGKAVAYWMQQEKIAQENVLVVVDDLALPIGKLRVRLKGSPAGHNGLKSIEATLGTEAYPRLKFGIGNDFPKGRQVEFVLGKWKPEEEPVIAKAIEEAAAEVEKFLFQHKI